jgi:hypothetical protein
MSQPDRQSRTLDEVQQNLRTGDDVARTDPGEDETDYEHRHFVNLLAAIFLLVIAIAISWTIGAMDSYEKLQRCFNTGRRDCVQIAPPRPAVQVPVR